MFEVRPESAETGPDSGGAGYRPPMAKRSFLDSPGKLFATGLLSAVTTFAWYLTGAGKGGLLRIASPTWTCSDENHSPPAMSLADVRSSEQWLPLSHFCRLPDGTEWQLVPWWANPGLGVLSVLTLVLVALLVRVAGRQSA
jgi:hypothetical protein